MATDTSIAKHVMKTVRIQVPKNLHEVPIISNLITEHNVIVNIRGAILDQKATGGGWFDLLLTGDSVQVESAVSYLRKVGVEIWNEE